jgi:hypothetical protein
MKKEWLVKTLALGIIILFVGTSFMPNINGDIGRISENQSLSVEIVNPREGYVHFSGIPLFPTILNLLADTVSFGGFRLRPIQVNATGGGPNGDYLYVWLFINDQDKGLGTWNPETGYYEWQWTGKSYGVYSLTVIAKDIFGAEDHAYMNVWNLCFIP